MGEEAFNNMSKVQVYANNALTIVSTTAKIKRTIVNKVYQKHTKQRHDLTTNMSNATTANSLPLNATRNILIALTF